MAKLRCLLALAALAPPRCGTVTKEPAHPVQVMLYVGPCRDGPGDAPGSRRRSTLSLPPYAIRQVWYPRVDADASHRWSMRLVARVAGEVTGASSKKAK